MIRFIVKRRTYDGNTGYFLEQLQTVDADCEELELYLKSGGRSDKSYDIFELIGTEILYKKDEAAVS